MRRLLRDHRRDLLHRRCWGRAGCLWTAAGPAAVAEFVGRGSMASVVAVEEAAPPGAS